jgi:hypothetical protein
MAQLVALTTGTMGLFGFRRLDNIRRRRLGRIGGIGGIPGEFSDLLSKLIVFLHKGFVGFKKFSNLLLQSADPLITQLQLSFKFSDPLFVKLFAFGGQFLSSIHLVRILLVERHPLLEEMVVLQMNDNLECVMNERIG